jgi:hypothetical protein
MLELDNGTSMTLILIKTKTPMVMLLATLDLLLEKQLEEEATLRPASRHRGVRHGPKVA